MRIPRLFVFLVATLVTSLFGSPRARALELADRDTVARAWAPTIFQETHNQRDLVSAFDFDGDWDGSNNAAHVDQFPLRAVVYYTTLETPTHWIITYVLYHPVDTKEPSGHDHDTEHVTVVVRKGNAPTGSLEAMETRFHHWDEQYVAPGAGVRGGSGEGDGVIHFDAASGHPAVYVQRTGHGICGGDAPPALFDTLSLYCDGSGQPHIHAKGVVYRYKGEADVPRSLDDRDVGYDLVEIGDTIWKHAHDIGPHQTFSTALSFHGERCNQYRCPTDIGGKLAPAGGHGSTGMPWEESPGKGGRQTGDAFFDPAFVFAHRYRFAEPFSTEYTWNPYLGVGRFDDGAAPAVAATGVPKNRAN